MRLSRLVSLCAVFGLLLGMMAVSASASSHREAPLISSDPQADHTDLYSFVDPHDPTMMDIIALVYPFEQPAGFPNGYTFSDQVLYTINIDNNGDAIADLRFGFKFHTTIRNEDTFYSNLTLAGDLAVTSPSDPDLNIVQTYDVGVNGSGGGGLTVPEPNARGVLTALRGAYTSPNRVGPNTHAGIGATSDDFAGIMQQAIYPLAGGLGNVWAGQADDPFFADLGAIWDLAQLRTITGQNGGQGIDTLADFNAQAIAMQLPIAKVTANHRMPTGVSDPNAAVGVWAANYRPQVTTLRPTITTNGSSEPKDYLGNRPQTSGNYVQVSRLGMPLTNEVIILLDQKDRWNRTDPRADAQFDTYYLNSHLAVLLHALFNTPGATTNRADLSTIFLTGIPGLNMVADSPAKAVKSDMLRLNLATASSFPNGRALTDDVIDIELSVVGLSDGTFAGLHTSGLSDGVNANDEPFQAVFPYVGVPHEGFSFNPDGGGD